MPQPLSIDHSIMTFTTEAPRLPAGGELMFWLLPPLQNARSVIAQLLAAQLDYAVHWCVGEFGKPALKCGAFSISWSHTRALTLVALRQFGALGVDIEGPRTLSAALLQRFYNDAERVLCKTEPDAARRIWCLKEAYVKAVGRGIAFGLQHIDCSGPALRMIDSQCAPVNFERPAFTASYRLMENHVGGLACLTEAPQAFVAIDLRQHCLESGLVAQ